MAGAQTMYRKIQIILDYAKKGKYRDKESLLEYISKRSPTNFTYFYRDRKTDKIVSRLSMKSIDHAVNLCIELKLISNKNFSLTKAGVSATNPERFPIILGRRVKELLSKKGIMIDTILETIIKILKESKPKPPTAMEIWKNLKYTEGEIDLKTFNRLTNLLGQCKVLLMTQKRIYLPYRGL